MKVTNTQYKLLPNEPTSKLLSTMHGKLPYCMGDIDHEVLIEVYRALLSEGLEVDQEPFLWIYRTLNAWEYSDYKLSKQKPTEQSAVDIVPVYTHPQPQRESLSEDEIFELFSKQNFTAYKIDDGTDHNDLVAVDRAFIDFARSIEKAHGIGAEK
jgi:hypothetical protein